MVPGRPAVAGVPHIRGDTDVQEQRQDRRAAHGSRRRSSWASVRSSGPGGLVIGLILGLVFVGGSYWFSDKIAVRAAGAVPVSEADAPQLYSIVRDLTQRADMPMPAIYISPAAQPNAFATGRNEHHAAVAVTQGLLQVVDQDELRGVLAHEISHVRNRDILIGSVAAAVALGITFLARMLMWGAIFGGGVAGATATAKIAPHISIRARNVMPSATAGRARADEDVVVRARERSRRRAAARLI